MNTLPESPRGRTYTHNRIMALISDSDREVSFFLTVGRTYCKVCGLYAVKLHKILLIEEFSLYYSDIKPAVFTLNFLNRQKYRIKLWFQNGKDSMRLYS